MLKVKACRRWSRKVLLCCAFVICIGLVRSSRRFKTLRIHLKNANNWNFTNILKLTIYCYNYHLPIVLDDLLILILLHQKPYHIVLDGKRRQMLLHYGFIILCHYILRGLYRPNSSELFERFIEKPINLRLNDQITAINDLLDEQLSHTPFLKDVVWEFVGFPMDNIDVDELIQTKRYVESLKKLHINTERDRRFDFLKEMLYRKYYRILKSIYSFNARYLQRDPDFFDIDHNESRFSWLVWWSGLRIFVHLFPRMIAPVLFYCTAGIEHLNLMDNSEIMKYGQIVIRREPVIFGLHCTHYVTKQLIQRSFDEFLVLCYQSLKVLMI